MPRRAGLRPLTPGMQALGARQAAELLGIGVHRFYALAKGDGFPCAVRLVPGGDLKWSREELMSWFKARPRYRWAGEEADWTASS